MATSFPWWTFLTWFQGPNTLFIISIVLHWLLLLIWVSSFWAWPLKWASLYSPHLHPLHRGPHLALWLSVESTCLCWRKSCQQSWPSTHIHPPSWPLFMIVKCSSPHPFWEQGLISRKTVFPWTGVEMVWGLFKHMGTEYIYCALYFYYYHIVIYNEIIIQLTTMQNQWVLNLFFYS